MVPIDRAFLDIYLDAWNAHDSAAVASHMADDAIDEDVALVYEACRRSQGAIGH
jgi:ketosteroid isomerase-like protein